MAKHTVIINTMIDDKLVKAADSKIESFDSKELAELFLIENGLHRVGMTWVGKNNPMLVGCLISFDE